MNYSHNTLLVVELLKNFEGCKFFALLMVSQLCHKAVNEERVFHFQCNKLMEGVQKENQVFNGLLPPPPGAPPPRMVFLGI